MTTETEKKPCMKAEPKKEHEWLKKMVGDWTIEAECMMGPDLPPYENTHVVRTAVELDLQRSAPDTHFFTLQPES